MLCAARWSGWTWQSPFWILAFACMVALNCQNTYQNACYDAKNWTNRTWSEFFYDGWKFQRQCVNVIDITWGRIYFSMCKNFGLSVQWPLMTRQRDVVVVRTALTAAMVVPSTMFKVYDPPNSETLVSKLFQNFPVINMTWEAVHIKFLIRKLFYDNPHSTWRQQYSNLTSI